MNPNGSMVFPANRRKGRPTIAFLASVLGPTMYQQKWQIWSGIERVCREQDINLLYVAGGQADNGPEALLYDLISTHAVDGILSWTGTVFSNFPREDASNFLQQYQPLPVVNVGWKLPGIPSVGFDQAQGVRDMVTHLIEVHGKRDIAYFYYQSTLNDTKESSYRGYEDTMRAYGLFRPELVADRIAVPCEDRKGQQKLRPLIDYQAALCAADSEALALIHLLGEQNIRVPEDILVTGIHDSQESRVAIPPLTTLRIPFAKGGRRAAELLIDLLHGKNIPELTLLPLEMILRQSCGCADTRATDAYSHSYQEPQDLFPHISLQNRELIVSEITASARFRDDLDPDWAGNLLDTFVRDVCALADESIVPQKYFLPELRKIMRSDTSLGIDQSSWHEVISVLRKRLLQIAGPQYRDAAEDLWQQARILVGQISSRSESRRFLSLAEQSQFLSEIETALHLAQDLPMLSEILAGKLPLLGITDCFICLYEDSTHPQNDARLIFGLKESGRIALPVDGIRFPAMHLVPEAMLENSSTYNFVIQTLHYLDEHFGYILLGSRNGKVFEMALTYETLRRQISAALKGISMLQQIEVARQKAEEANQLKSQFLSMVSHELRTPLNLIVSLCEMADWKQSHADESSPAKRNETISQYLTQIHSSAQHLDWLIRDVLDLASSQVGQLQLANEPIDLSEVLRETSLLGEKMAFSKHLKWIVNIPERMPLINGDRARIRQVVLNMVSNAVKFTAHGEVELGASFSDREVTVYIRDTGVGVPVEEQTSIFDEFRQSERTASRGYGGTGLGLAITRRLVNMHGGQVGVHSPGTEGGGSTFYFTLPILMQRETPQHTLTVERAENVVLLCQRGEKNYRLVQDLIQQGFELNTWFFEEGEGWLDYILERQPTAVIVDCLPENEEGWKIMRVLKEHPDTKMIPVLFYAFLAEQDHGVVLSMDVLQKPVQETELRRILDLYQLKEFHPDGGKPVLVADDEPGILGVHAQMLAELLPGCRILQAQDGLQAWRLIQAELPGLVLLDLMMPEMNGFAVLEAMQDNAATREVPVVIITGQILTDWEMNQLNHRVKKILAKGLFSTEETMAHLRLALTRDRGIGTEAQRLVRMAMAYIHTNYKEAINRPEIARHLGMDEDYLTRCFKRELGLSPVTYLNRYRISQAKLLLEQNCYSVAEVAQQVGFSSQSYFTRVFQREVGVSPKAYHSGTRNPSD